MTNDEIVQQHCEDGVHRAGQDDRCQCGELVIGTKAEALAITNGERCCDLISGYIAAIDATVTAAEASEIARRLRYFSTEFSRWADVADQRAITNRRQT